jgi:hypothetical protein
MEELIQLSKDYIFAKQKYEHAVMTIVRTSPVMQDKSLFWKMLGDLILFIDKQLHKRADPVRNGISSWLNHVWSKQEDYSEKDIPSFVRTYGKLKESLAKKLLKMDNPLKSELTDIIDSLPLAGKIVCIRIVSSDEIKDIKTLESIVEKGCLLAHCILHKENHSEQWLEQIYADRLCDFYGKI